MSLVKNLFWDEILTSLRLVGPGVRDFLQGQTTSEINTLQEGQIISSCWLSAIGKLRALLEIRLDNEGADVVVVAGNSVELVEGFEQVIFPADKVLLKTPSQIRRIQILGKPDSQSFKEVFWLLPGELLPEKIKYFRMATFDEFESWRLQQGLLRGAGEINGTTNPFELGLSDLVNLQKGCYLGQETMAKLARTCHLRQELRFWRSDATISLGQNLFATSPHELAHKELGIVTSVMQMPNSKASIGLAMIRRQALSEEELFLEDKLTNVKLSIPLGFVPLSAQ